MLSAGLVRTVTTCTAAKFRQYGRPYCATSTLTPPSWNRTLSGSVLIGHREGAAILTVDSGASSWYCLDVYREGGPLLGTLPGLSRSFHYSVVFPFCVY